MTKFEILDLFVKNGALSEKEILTIYGENDIESCTFQREETFLVAPISDENHIRAWKNKLESVYEENTKIELLTANGKILKSIIKKFNSENKETIVGFLLKAKDRNQKIFGKQELNSLIDVMKGLREPGGCPWDRQQNHKSLRTYFIQEVYEVIDAIDKNDMKNLCEELGDVLFQVIFHARLAEERGDFSIKEVVEEVTRKMKKRHPFVFKRKENPEKFVNEISWEKRKRKEKNRKYLLSGIPKCLPSLLLACIIQKKVSSAGIHTLSNRSWRNAGHPVKTGNDAGDESVGAFLFEQVRVLQEKGVNPELSLHQFCVEFMERFSSFEDDLQRKQKSIDLMSPETLEQAWMEFNRKEM